MNQQEDSMLIRFHQILVGLTMGLLILLTACQMEDFSTNHYLKFYGMEGSHEGGKMLQNEDDTAYIFGTASLLGGNSTLYLAKINVEGDVIWENSKLKSYDGSEILPEKAIDFIQTQDNKLLLLSEVNVNGNINFHLTLYDPDQQDTIRTGKYGGSMNELAYSVTEIRASELLPHGYIVCGKSTETVGGDDLSDAFQLFVNESLTPINSFISKYNQGNNDAAVRALQYDDNKILVFGYTDALHDQQIDPSGSFNFWVYLLNERGVPIVNVKLPNSVVGTDPKVFVDNTDEFINDAIATSFEVGEGYLLSGISEESVGFNYPYLLKLNTNLEFDNSDIVFRQVVKEENLKLTIDAAEDSRTKTVHSCVARSGHYYVVATQQYTTSFDILLMKISSTGKRVWSRSLGGNSLDEVSGVQEAPNGDIFVYGTMTVGETSKKIVLMRLDNNGRIE